MIRKCSATLELVSVRIVEGVRDDRLRADRYFCRVDLEIRKWREMCVRLKPEQVARTINCLILAGDKEGVGMDNYHGGLTAPVIGLRSPSGHTILWSDAAQCELAHAESR